MQVCKHTLKQVCGNSSMQVCKIEVCMYENLQVWKYANLKVCKNARILFATCYLWLAICYLLTKSFYLKLALTCKNFFLSLVVVRLVIFNLHRHENNSEKFDFSGQSGQYRLRSLTGRSGWFGATLAIFRDHFLNQELISWVNIKFWISRCVSITSSLIASHSTMLSTFLIKTFTFHRVVFIKMPEVFSQIP